MLRGIEHNDIIAGGYADKRLGGICPMLAAHRNGGRINLASFARAWDRFTAARRPRLATDRELRALRSYLELSLLRDEQDDQSVTALAEQLRRERPPRRTRRTRRPRAATGERPRARQVRRMRRWAWLIPSRRYDVFSERLAAAEEHHSMGASPPGPASGGPSPRASEFLKRPRPRAGSTRSG